MKNLKPDQIINIKNHRTYSVYYDLIRGYRNLYGKNYGRSTQFLSLDSALCNSDMVARLDHNE